MSLDFRFAIISDPHIALPHTLWDYPHRLHLVEISIPAFENALERLSQLNLDFLLLPGDLTQHGEPDNHRWLADRLAQLPYPAYVIPGNHDILQLQADDRAIGSTDFPHYYRSFGYKNLDQLYYTRQLLPGVRLIGLNSIGFDAQGRQVGRLDEAQLNWLQQVLADFRNHLILVVIHHNVIEHIPDQARHPIGRRYILKNASTLLSLLHQAGVQLIFTGHLHVQNIAYSQGIYDITTGSLISYPHPYRILRIYTDNEGKHRLNIESDRVESVPGWQTLQQASRNWMGTQSPFFLRQFLTQPPLTLSVAEADLLIPSLRYFWADFANGDAIFNFPDLPSPVRDYFERYSAVNKNGQLRLADNDATLVLD